MPHLFMSQKTNGFERVGKWGERTPRKLGSCHWKRHEQLSSFPRPDCGAREVLLHPRLFGTPTRSDQLPTFVRCLR